MRVEVALTGVGLADRRRFVEPASRSLLAHVGLVAVIGRTVADGAGSRRPEIGVLVQQARDQRLIRQPLGQSLLLDRLKVRTSLPRV